MTQERIRELESQLAARDAEVGRLRGEKSAAIVEAEQHRQENVRLREAGFEAIRDARAGIAELSVAHSRELATAREAGAREFAEWLMINWYGDYSRECWEDHLRRFLSSTGTALAEEETRAKRRGEMSKIFSSAQVVIMPKQFRYQKETSAEIHSSCERIKAQVKRHVDDVGEIVVESTDPVCSYCGRKWTESNPHYNGGCCKDDEENATPEQRRSVYPDDCEHGCEPGSCAQCAAENGEEG